MIVADDRARRQCLGLHLEVDFGIAVGGCERDVTEPRADGVDIHAGAEQCTAVVCLTEWGLIRFVLSEGIRVAARATARSTTA